MIPEDNQATLGGFRRIIIEHYTEIRVIPLRFQGAGSCRLGEEALKSLPQWNGSRSTGGLSQERFRQQDDARREKKDERQ